MAFILVPALTARGSSLARQSVTRRPVVCMSSSSTPPPPQGTTTNETPPAGYELGDGYELDTDAIKGKAMEVVSDVGTRPLYYGKIVGYAVGALVAFTVLRAVVVAVDSLPVLPGALELIGLGYTTWFVWRYVLFKESREELLEEVEDFLGRAKPGPQ